MKINRLLILILLLSCLLQKAAAVMAYPYPIKVTQPDGSTITVTIHGDEFCHWMTVGDQVVKKGENGFYRPDTLSRQILETAVLKQQAANIKRTAMRKSADFNSLTIGTSHFLVMLIEFDDLRFTIPNPDSAFYKMLNEENYTENGATGSVRDYFHDQSMGLFSPVYDVVGPITVPEAMKTFSKSDGQTQSGAPALLVKACQIADSIVDFSKYDFDGDGYIDNIFFYYAGYNAAEGADGTIWPHSWAVYGTHCFDGKYLGNYACTSEYRGFEGGNMAGIGTFCHEFGHVIGLPDFYDTNGSAGGSTNGLWTYSLMCYGNYNNDGMTPPYFNCEERCLLGWIDSIPWLPSNDSIMTIGAIQDGHGFRSPTENDGEYHCYEYRPAVKWDNYIEPGVLIYHVDKSNNKVNGITAANRWKNGNGINDYTHECFKLEQADEISKCYAFGYDNTQFNANTSPSSMSWNSVPSSYAVYDIECDTMTASFQLLYNHPREIFGVTADKSGNPIPYSCITVNDSQYKAYSDSAGCYYINLEELNTNELQLCVTAAGYESFTKTLTINAGALKFDVQLADRTIYLESTERQGNNRFFCHDRILEYFTTDSDIMEIYAIDGRRLARIPVENNTACWYYGYYKGAVIIKSGRYSCMVML